MKNIFLLLCFLLGASALFAQGNIGINDPSPDPLAILDMESTTQGVLVPRMTEADRTAIPAGADQKGLLVFQTDNNEGFWYYNGTAWEKLGETGGRIVDFAFSSGYGSDPIDGTSFLGPTTTISITSPDQKVLVTANRAFGSSSAGGANGLGIAIGFLASGSADPPSTIGGWILGLRVAQNTRVTFGVSGIITGLSPGDYLVGMAGSGGSGFANWNSNEYGYVTAIVFE